MGLGATRKPRTPELPKQKTSAEIQAEVDAERDKDERRIRGEAARASSKPRGLIRNVGGAAGLVRKKDTLG